MDRLWNKTRYWAETKLWQTDRHLLCGRSLLEEISYKKDRSVWFEKKIWLTTAFYFNGHQKHRSFSCPYVEPPSKSTTASNDLSSDDDAIEIETSEIVKKNYKSIKSRTAGYITTPVKMVTFVWYYSHINMNKPCTWLVFVFCVCVFFLLFNTSKKFPKCSIFFPNSGQRPFPK